jgi:4-coumarate--CoA ligase
MVAALCPIEASLIDPTTVQLVQRGELVPGPAASPVVDRLKELIKYKGFQVPPAELEAVLLRHPDVADAAVIGLPDDEAGEIPAGYVVLRPGAAASPEEIMRFVAGEVASYKQIRRLEVIDAIPKSAAGKTLRRVLRDSART